MFRSLPALAATLALALTTPAFAQSETEPDTDAPEADGLSLGEPVGQEPGVGDTYVVEAFTDWELRCIRAADGNDPCQLYQLLRDEAGNAVAEFTIFPLQGGGQAAAGGTVITPLETLLTAQLRISVDGADARRYPFAFCSQIGCFSRIGLTQPEVDQFKAGSVATVQINPAAAPEETVNLRLSLAGFTAGFETLRERQAAE